MHLGSSVRVFENSSSCEQRAMDDQTWGRWLPQPQAEQVYRKWNSWCWQPDYTRYVSFLPVPAGADAAAPHAASQIMRSPRGD